jgi:hypothetical protein
MNRERRFYRRIPGVQVTQTHARDGKGDNTGVGRGGAASGDALMRWLG